MQLPVLLLILCLVFQCNKNKDSDVSSAQREDTEVDGTTYEC